MSKPQNEQEWREKCLELARLGVGPVARRLGNAMTPALEALMAYIDAARAAEAAQHQQEIAAKDAEIEHLQHLAETDEYARGLEARLAAVEAERDQKDRQVAAVYADVDRLTNEKQALRAERDRLEAANERLERLVKSQRPELSQLRDVECGLRAYLQNGAKQLERTHALVQSLLPPNDDDLPTFGELRGIMSAALSGEGTKP